MNISIKRAQNDACIGSAEREKYGTQFKKTFRFLSMATLLVVGAIMTGCSNEDNIDNSQQPANKDNVVTLTATVSLDGGAQTRAITPSTGVKTFESGNQIAVIYKNTSSQTVKAVSTDFTPTGDNTKATFTVTLTNPDNNSTIRYIYPATMAKDVATDATITDDDATIDYTDLLGSQDGTLATLANYDLAVKDAALSGTNLPASASLENPLTICKFTLTDGTSPITSSVTSLNVSDGTNTYHVTPSGLSEIYVAMKPVASQKIAFTAATTLKTYFKTTASAQSLAASKIYNSISVSMTELAVGNVFCSDGSVYASASAAKTASKTPVAKIVYLGSDAETSTTFKHGLALALSDVSGYHTWCSQKGANCLGTGHQYTSMSAAKADMAGLANTDALVGHGTHTHNAANAARNYSATRPAGTSAWFLSSAGQWDKMTGGYGLTNLKADESDYKRLQSDAYWSSTEFDAYYAWDFGTVVGNWYGDNKDNNYLVRSCLAF